MKRVLEALESGIPILPLSGLGGSAPVYLVSHLIRRTHHKNFIYLTATESQAQGFFRDLQFFMDSSPFRDMPPESHEPSIALYPAYDNPPYSALSPHLDIVADRIRILARLNQKDAPRCLVTSLAALLSWTLPPEILQTAIHILKKDEEISRELLIEQLTQWGYQKVPIVEDAGTFAIRGALMDIATPCSEDPLRIEFFGDIIESIRTFDPKTQKSLKSLSEISLTPTRETLMSPSTVKFAIKNIQNRCNDLDIPKNQRGSLIEDLKEGLVPQGLENFLALYYEKGATLIDYLPSNTHWILEHPLELKNTWTDLQAELADLFPHQKDLKQILNPEICYYPFSQWQKDLEERLKGPTKIHIEEFASDDPRSLSFQVETNEDIRQTMHHTKKGESLLAPLVEKLNQWVNTSQILITASHPIQAQRIIDLMEGTSLPLKICPDSLDHALHMYVYTRPFRELSHDVIWIVIGHLSQGFRTWAGAPDALEISNLADNQRPEKGLVIITEDEIFGAKTPKRTTPKKGADYFSSLSEIMPGDPVVHQDHGVGLYRGLNHMNFEGVENDFLLLEYNKGDKLFLPISRINLIQRYVGTEGKTPPLDNLGSPRWEKLKKQAQESIREMAGELINLYAERETGQGHAFSKVDPLFESFEAGFPFEETEDQATAIRDVLDDMALPKPMDRLILGDVGYGKTEVAMRAAFKAVLESKQAAVLVPTTLLACQHLERFQERFHDFPIKIEMLSRFRTLAQQKKIVAQLREGTIDIIIGTHRLLQSDISYKELGLLVVDEEHRFGVRHKEKIKRLKKSVDVMSMSATPIPRTLFMSLIGIRKISVIETPPHDRLAIRTFVTHFDEGTIREAIMREIRRGGQIFFVHNRVEGIENILTRLRGVVPEATIEIGHGQMAENALEDVMIRFSQRKFDILLCTTIIESGIDIPTANTIIINRSDKMGLAQIYQLRGRVGRSKQRAYCYLLIPEKEQLTPDAKKRIQVLQKFSDLGTGFRLASHDLEIRGAGNLLGTKQSGQISALGYELYTELLEKAVYDLKGEPLLDDIDPEINFRIPAFIPEDYIPDHSVRLDLYRRLASPSDETQMVDLQSEMEDRFGPLPLVLENLVSLMGLKILAKALRLKSLKYDTIKYQLAFDNTTPLDPDIIMKWVHKDPKKYNLSPDMCLTIRAPNLGEKERLGEARKLLNTMIQHVS